MPRRSAKVTLQAKCNHQHLGAARVEIYEPSKGFDVGDSVGVQEIRTIFQLNFKDAVKTLGLVKVSLFSVGPERLVRKFHVYRAVKISLKN